MAYKSTDCKVFGDNIRFLRKMHHLSQKQMAKIMGISLYCLRKLEQGFLPNSLYIDSVILAARYFHLPPSLLFSTHDAWNIQPSPYEKI